MEIVAFGLSTAFGSGRDAIRAALAEGKEALTRRPDLIGSDYQRQLCAFAPEAKLNDLLGRVMALIASALHDLAAQLAMQQIGWPHDTGLVLLTPRSDAGLPAALAEAISAQAETNLRAAGWVGAQAPALRLQGGAGCTAHALQAAVQASASAGDGRAMLVVMADSYACRHRVNALLATGALFSRATPWGFVPGEAACVALILPAVAGANSTVLRIGAACEAREPIPEHLNQDSAHIGMTEAALSALETCAAQSLPPPGHLLTDWNNSRYKAAEFSYTMLRLTGLLAPGCAEAEHPVQRFGQCGAAWFATVLGQIQLQENTPILGLSGDEASDQRSAIILVPHTGSLA